MFHLLCQAIHKPSYMNLYSRQYSLLLLAEKITFIDIITPIDAV